MWLLMLDFYPATLLFKGAGTISVYENLVSNRHIKDLEFWSVSWPVGLATAARNSRQCCHLGAWNVSSMAQSQMHSGLQLAWGRQTVSPEDQVSGISELRNVCRQHLLHVMVSNLRQGWPRAFCCRKQRATPCSPAFAGFFFSSSNWTALFPVLSSRQNVSLGDT